MTEAPGVFRSRDSLREAFVDGLELMLAEHHDLGVFILALANASYDRSIYQRLQAPCLRGSRPCRHRYARPCGPGVRSAVPRMTCWCFSS